MQSIASIIIYYYIVKNTTLLFVPKLWVNNKQKKRVPRLSSQNSLC